MSTEVKRVALKTVTSATSSSVPMDKKKSKDSKTPKEPKSNRFVLELNAENDECNEFSFSDLMKSLNNNVSNELLSLNSNQYLIICLTEGRPQ